MNFPRSLAAAFAVALLAVSSVGFIVASKQAVAGQPKLPDSPFKFTALSENDVTRIEADPSTFSSFIDEDGDVLSGGIFRVIRKNAVAGEPAVLISLNVAVCGSGGMIIVRSKDYDLDGKIMKINLEPRAFAGLTPESIGGAAYTALCTGAKPTPIDPGYKVPDGYTKFWT